MHQKDADQRLREDGKQWEGRREGLSFDMSGQALKDCKQIDEDTGYFSVVLYEYHVLFFVLFCIFQNKNGGNGGNSAPVEML